jgi:hypothetical protein
MKHRKQIYLGFGEGILDAEVRRIRGEFESYASRVGLPIAAESEVGASVFYRVQQDEFPQSALDLKTAVEEIAGPGRRVHQKYRSSLAYTVYPI